MLGRFALGLLALALGAVPVLAEDADPPTPPSYTEQAAFLGLSLVPVAQADGAATPRHDALAGMGVAWAETRPIRWGDVDPRPPDHPVARYDWKAVDDTVLGLQRAGFAPLLVLSPECGWAEEAREQTDWGRFVTERVPETEVALAVAWATGVAPPRSEAYVHWQRFVRDLVERYDGDGQRDMPGLRRPVLEIQVLDQVQRPSRWLGGAGDYQRLLLTAREGAREASPSCSLMHASVDLHGLMRAEDSAEPDRWRERLVESLPAAPALARLETTRGIELVLETLRLTSLYDGVSHVGSGNLAEDVRNVRALREVVSAQGVSRLPIWLSQGPSRRLARARVPVPDDRLAAAEEQLRATAFARAQRAAEDDPARRWLRRGTAYDLVRGIALLKAAGARRILCYGLTDEPWRRPGEEEVAAAGLQGLLRPVTEADGSTAWRPTPSWFALRQANRLLLGHRDASLSPLGTNGTAVVFSFPERHPLPWVAVLLPDAMASWAGPLESEAPTREVTVPLPDGAVEIEEFALEDGLPRRSRALVRDNVLRVSLGTAPVYVVPSRDPR